MPRVAVVKQDMTLPNAPVDIIALAKDLRAGSRAALEVRARDVPFMVEDGQPVCKLAFERMAEEPDVLYGEDVGSNYQGQETMLSKHFLEQALPVRE